MVTVINNKAELAKAYGNDHEKLVVMEFMVPWSELCKFMVPAVEELAKKYEGHAYFYTLDTDKFKDQAREKGVEVLPTFLLLKDGKELERIVGINKNLLEDSIKQHTGTENIETNNDAWYDSDMFDETHHGIRNFSKKKDVDCIIL